MSHISTPRSVHSAVEATASPHEMYSHMVNVISVKVTASGQMSLPAHLRRRWQVDEVLVVDKGDYALIRPAPQDAVSELRGSLPQSGFSTDDARAQERELEARLEEERWSSSTPPH